MKQPRTRREKEIWQACDELFTQSEDIQAITGNKIMQKLVDLGFKRGCGNEIYKYRRSWWELRGFTEAEAKGIADSSNHTTKLNDPISKAVLLVQDELKNNAKAEIEHIKSELEAKIVDLTQELITVTKEREQLQRDKLELDATITAVKTENYNLTTDLQKSRAEQLVYVERINNLTTEYNNYKAASDARVAEILASFDVATKEASKQTQSLSELHTKQLQALQNTMEQQRHESMQQIDALQLQNSKLQQEILAAKDELSSISCELGATKAKLNDYVASFTVASEEKIKLQDKLVILQEISANQNTLQDKQEQQGNMLSKCLQELTTEFAKINTKLTAKRKKAHAKITEPV